MAAPAVQVPVAVVNPNAHKNACNYIGEFLEKKIIFTSGLKMGAGILTVVVKVAAPALGSAVEAIQTLADKWIEVRKWLMVGDFVEDIVGMLKNEPPTSPPTSKDTHAIQLGVAASAFFAASDIFNPVFLFASVGFFALAPVVGQVLGIVAASFGVVGLTLTVVNAIYKLAIGDQSVGLNTPTDKAKEGLKIFSKTLSVVGTVVGIVAVELALVTFPYAAIVALVAGNIASPAIELVRAWL